MPAQLPFHFGPALRPISHGNPAGPGNPLFARTARVFGDAASSSGPTTPGADQTGATVSTTPPTAPPASPAVVPTASSYFTAPVLIGAALLYFLILK